MGAGHSEPDVEVGGDKPPKSPVPEGSWKNMLQPSLKRQPTVDLLEPNPVEHEELTGRELHFDERIRTVSQAITALGVIAAGMYYLRTVLIPFFLALALKYLLTPLIDTLSCRGLDCPLRLPRALAVIFAIFLALSGLMLLALILARSVSTFSERADFYGGRVQTLITDGYVQIRSYLPTDAAHNLDDLNVSSELQSMLAQASLGDLILGLLGTAGALAENVLYITLFLMFMLVGHGADAPKTGMMAKIDKQIFIYIRGKVGIYMLVGVINCSLYFSIGLELWLVFGVLAFFLAFIPNIGLAISVCLPMPIVILDPTFSAWDTALTFLGPAFVGTIAKDVLEPLVLGNATSLHPVAVVMSIMLFGSVWGITGMVMAVPMTAVIRLVVSNVDHPLARFACTCLAGTSGPPLPGGRESLKRHLMPGLPEPAQLPAPASLAAQSKMRGKYHSIACTSSPPSMSLPASPRGSAKKLIGQYESGAPSGAPML